MHTLVDLSSKKEIAMPFEPPHYGPYNSTSPTGSFALVESTSGASDIKEYHGENPVLELLMDDGRLAPPHYGQVARNNSNWNLSAIKTIDTTGKPSTTVYFGLKTTTFWTTIAGDGTYLHRNGYLLAFCRGGAGAVYC
jgi:hypothetical protein